MPTSSRGGRRGGARAGAGIMMHEKSTPNNAGDDVNASGGGGGGTRGGGGGDGEEPLSHQRHRHQGAIGGRGGVGNDDDRNDAAMQGRHVDRRRNTPLHLACCHQPPPLPDDHPTSHGENSLSCYFYLVHTRWGGSGYLKHTF